MRTPDDAYWSTSLPKDHEALHALDAYCKEWGGLTRAEATRRLLIEWARLRSGKEIITWSPAASPSSATSRPGEASSRLPGGGQNLSPRRNAARAASQVLDE